MDFPRPGRTSLVPQGAKTANDLVPADGTEELVHLIKELVMSSRAFALEEGRIAVLREELREYPIEKGSGRFESLLEALKLAVLDQ